MTPPTNCPKCGVSWIGDPIPANIAEHYSGTHFRREIGHVSWSRDRVTHYQCPDCHALFDREYKAVRP